MASGCRTADLTTQGMFTAITNPLFACKRFLPASSMPLHCQPGSVTAITLETKALGINNIFRGLGIHFEALL